MESAVVTPPYVAGPLRLLPFRAMRLAASRLGAPSSARAFARPYKDVAERLGLWETRGHLHHDPTPGLYIHEYTVSGITVRGLVGALDVSRRAAQPSQRAILPHEGIYPGQADDLADRMAEMGINPAPILLVQRSPVALRTLLSELRAREPDHHLVDRAEQTHRLWAVTDPDHLNTIADLLAPTTALIADGHHRYAAYLRLQQRNPGGRYRPRPGHAGRPGRHPPVPRCHPPRAARIVGERCRRRGGGPGDRDPAHLTGGGRCRARADHTGRDRQRRVGSSCSSSSPTTGSRSRSCTNSWCRPSGTGRAGSPSTTPSTRRSHTSAPIRAPPS